MENFETLFKWAQTDFLSLNRIEQLRAFFGDLKIAWEKAEKKSFLEAGIHPKGVEAFFRKKDKIDFEKAYKNFEKCGAKMIFIEDKNYPQRLSQINAPPIFLFVRGEILPEDDFSFAVVGSRTFSPYGKEGVLKIVPDLAKAGFTIVSGLARGIDALAHKEALRMEGRTIAVLGSGIDNIWPHENKTLAENIINDRGAVISEFPIGTAPLSYNFPRRNRIISGLSMGILVIEGKERSGSLITAHIALEQGREVFALPGGGFTALSAGPNKLIKKGEAKLISSVEDILEEFNIKLKKDQPERPAPKDAREKAVYELLGTEPKLFDDLVEDSEFNSAELSSLLTILEMKSFAQNLGMGRWIRL